MASSKKPPAALPFADQVAIFQRFQTADPAPETELDYVNPFTLVVAVALSAQATDVGVNKATRGLFAVADTPEKMLALGLEGVTEHIKTIGLFRQKARNVMALSQILVDRYDSQVPDSRAALMSLPGVGRKTANVVLSCAFDHPAQAVDTHIFRVGNRTRHRPRPRCRRGRTRHRGPCPRPFPGPCASLADPAWSLYLSGQTAPLRDLPDRRPVSL